MSHKHIHNCKHANIKYCTHCGNIYCEDCDQEWVKKSSNMYYGTTHVYADDKAWTKPVVTYSEAVTTHGHTG